MSRQVMKPSDYEREKARVMNGVDINSEKAEMEENKRNIGSCVSDFTVVKELGRGSYGVVYRVLSNISKKEYVMKKINIKHMDQKHQKEAIKEAQILRRVRHENIIRYYTSFVEHDCLYIIMEYADGGDLQQRLIVLFAAYQYGWNITLGLKLKQLLRTLREEKRQFTEGEIVEICADLIKAVEYLHRNNIIHRDIKTLNIFLTKTRKIKLGDLGASKLVSNADAQQGTRVGTPLYLAPELVKQQPYDFKVDIWAIGIVLYHIAVLEPPFSGDNLIALGFNIVHKQQKPLPSMYSQRLANLVNRLLDKSPTTRPSASELMQLEWLNQEKSSPKSLSLQFAATATSSTRQATNFSDKIEVFDKGSYLSLLNRIDEDKEEQSENVVIADNPLTKVSQSKRTTTGKQPTQINNNNNSKGEIVSNDYNSVQVKLKKPTTLGADGQRIDYMNDDIYKKQKELKEKEKEIEKNQEQDYKSKENNSANYNKNNVGVKLGGDGNDANSNRVQQNLKTQVDEVTDKKATNSKYKTQASFSSDKDTISNKQPDQLQQHHKQYPSQQIQPKMQQISPATPVIQQEQIKPASKNNSTVNQDIQSNYFSNAKQINPTPSSASYNNNFKIRPFSAQLPNTTNSNKQLFNKDSNLDIGQKIKDASQLEQMIKEFKQEAQKIKETASGGVAATNKQIKHQANQQQQDLPTQKIKQPQGGAQENAIQLNRPQSAHPFLENKQRQVFNQFNNRYVSAAVSPQQNQFLGQNQLSQQRWNAKVQSLQQYFQMPSALIQNKLAVNSFIQKNIGNMNSNAIVEKDDPKGRQTKGTQANAAAAKSETKHLNERNSDKNAFYRIDNVQREFSEDTEQEYQKQSKQQPIHSTNLNNNSNQLAKQRPTTAISKVKSATSANFYSSVESNNNGRQPQQQHSSTGKEVQNTGGKPLILNNARPQTASTLRRKYTIKDLQPSNSSSSPQAKAL